MPPNKSKRPCREDSPESDRCSKKLKHDDDVEEEEEKTQDGDRSKAGCSTFGPNGLRSPGQSGHNKPAELFRKDLISAMKLADSEPLLPEEYLLIADQWKQEWEKGVQVPVNKEGIPDVSVVEVRHREKTGGDFKIPKKFLHAAKDESYQQGIHEFTGMQQLAEQVVRYDLDDMDVCWLKIANNEREENGEILINEWIMERVIESLEAQCHEKIATKKKTEEGLGIEYDEDVVCEVCRSPESEDNNEMVFCDGCDICVHQACYGIQKIPEGSWLCRVCALGIKPTCILCPKTGGAMKSTRSGTKWAHVSCALWIPEVTIGCVEKMEPVTKISQIPASRWSLICCVCKERTGACIQCSVKACKTAFHVTCAFGNGLEMKTILTNDHSDEGIKLKGYCPRHSGKRERGNSESDTDSPRKSISGSPRKELTDEEIAKMRAEKLKQLQEQFYKEVDLDQIAESLQVEPGAVEMIAAYWKLKRKTMFDAPLLTPKTEEEDLLEKQQEDSLIARMKMFVQLRQDLERVRNLCYMVSKREKIKKQYYKIRENVFMGQVRALTDGRIALTDREAHKIVNKYHHNSIYDQKEFEKLEATKLTTIGRSVPQVVETESVSPEEKSEMISHAETLRTGSIVSFRDRKHHHRRTKHWRRHRRKMNISVAVKTEAEEEADLAGGDANVGTSVDNESDIVINEKVKTESTDISKSFIAAKMKKRESRRSGKEETESLHVKDLSSTRDRRSKSSLGNSVTEESDMIKNRRKSEKDVTDVIDFKSDKETRKSTPIKANVKIQADEESEFVNTRELRSVSNSKPEEIIVSPPANKTLVTSKPKQAINFCPKVNGKVSERIKAEISHYMRNAKLVIPEKVKDKVQRGLQRSASKSRLKHLNGVHDPSQRKIDTIFRSTRKSEIIESKDTVNGKNVSRVLNEISPSRTRHAGNAWYSPTSSPKGSLGGYRIPKKSIGNGLQSSPRAEIEGHKHNVHSHESSPGPETRSARRRIDHAFDSSSRDGLSRRSSRENSPESTASLRSGIGSYRGAQRGEMERMLTRASSPASSCRSHSDYIDVENLFHDSDITSKRVTRSQLNGDSENSHDSSDSRRSYVHNLIS